MPDDSVDIKVTADNTAALSALESIAGALQKIGDKGKEAGERHHESSTWAAKGMEELTGSLASATSAAGLFETGVELVTKKLEAMREAARAALEARAELATNERNWQDFLRPGEHPGAIAERLGQIGEQTSMGVENAQRAFGQLMAGRAETTSADDVLADLSAAGASTADPGRAAARALAIRNLRQTNPQFSDEGAAAELTRRGWQTGQLGTVEKLQATYGGANSFEQLSDFVSSLGPRLAGNEMTASRIAGVLIEHAQQATGSKSIAAAEAFYRTPEGKAAAARITGELETESGEFQDIGKDASGLRDREARSILAAKLRGGASSRTTPAPNAPGALAAAAALRDETTGTTRQKEAAGARVYEQSQAEVLAGRTDPEQYFITAEQTADTALAREGYWNTWLSTRWAMKSTAEMRAYGGFGLAPEEQQNDLRRKEFGIEALRERVSAQADSTHSSLLQNAVQRLDQILAEMREANRVAQQPATMKIEDGGEHHNARTAAPAAGK